MRSGLGHQRVEQRRVHGPTVEIEALPAGSRRMENRVDIVGAGLGRLNPKPTPPERAEATMRPPAVMRLSTLSDRCFPGRYSESHGSEGTRAPPRLDHRHLC